MQYYTFTKDALTSQSMILLTLVFDIDVLPSCFDQHIKNQFLCQPKTKT